MQGQRRTGPCVSFAPGDASLAGDTFQHALRHQPWGRLSGTGRGTGRVRWAEFASGTGGDGHNELFAVDPRLVKRGAFEREYYGVEVGAGCMSRRAARRLVRTMRITPVEHDPAATQRWTGGQTASYTIRVADGPAYLVAFDVPEGVTYETDSIFEIDGWTSPPQVTVTNNAGVCSIGVGDARLEGDTFEQALRDAPDFEDKLSATGPGTGSVRWVEFASTSSLGHKRYDLFALDPRLVREVGTVNQYYGFEISASCMTRAMARELVRTVSLTPLAGAR